MQRSQHTTNAPPRTGLIRAAALLSGLLVALFVAACSGESASEQEPAAFTWPEGERPIAVLEIEGFGEVHIALYPELAPKTVENFVGLIEDDFYLGTTFHRIVPGFMMQGGDVNSKDDDIGNDGNGVLDFQIADEFSDASHERGVVSMANRGRNTGDSQFFILYADAHQLDGKHSIFGRVVKGMDLIDQIEKVPTDKNGRWGPRDRPLEDIKIVRASVLTTGGTAAAEARAATPGDTAEAGSAEAAKSPNADRPNA